MYDQMMFEDDIFTALGITEEWEDEDVAHTYAEEDARTLREYGY